MLSGGWTRKEKGWVFRYGRVKVGGRVTVAERTCYLEGGKIEKIVKPNKNNTGEKNGNNRNLT